MLDERQCDVPLQVVLSYRYATKQQRRVCGQSVLVVVPSLSGQMSVGGLLHEHMAANETARVSAAPFPGCCSMPVSALNQGNAMPLNVRFPV